MGKIRDESEQQAVGHLTWGVFQDGTVRGIVKGCRPFPQYPGLLRFDIHPYFHMLEFAGVLPSINYCIPQGFTQGPVQFIVPFKCPELRPVSPRVIEI